jgi:hypothetical protein
MTTHFHAGRNTPGYLPDGDFTWLDAHLTFDEAKAALIHDLKFLEDHAVGEAEAESACHAAEDANLWAESDLLLEWSVKVEDGTEHGLGTVFWIATCTEASCELDEEMVD